MDQALRALRHRDRSVHEIDRYLAERGVEEADRQGAVETLARTGLLDDRRFAELRAASLAHRSAGDDAIRHALRSAGVSTDVVEDALTRVEPEVERARRVVAARGSGPKTARYLAGKGFAYETVRAVVADDPPEALG
jgi:regulatory protein